MSNRSDEYKFLLEELSLRLRTPENFTSESILVGRLNGFDLETQSLNLEEGHTVALIDGKLVSVPYRGLQFKFTIESGESQIIFNTFHEYLSSKFVVDIEATDPSRNKSGALELLVKPLRSGFLQFNQYSRIGELPLFKLDDKFVDSKHCLEITNLEPYSLDVYLKVLK